MALSNRKITPYDISQKGVIAAPDRLSGSANENKAVFDRLIRDVVSSVVNSIVDDLVGKGGASEIGFNPIADITSGNIQAAITSLKTIVDSKAASINVDTSLNLKSDKSDTDLHFKDISFDTKTGIFTFTRQNGTTKSIDTPVEKIAINFKFNEATQSLELTLEDGTVQVVNLSAFITETEFKDSDQIDFSVNNHVVTATIKNGSITDTMLSSALLAMMQGYVSACASSATAAAASETSANTYKSAAESARNAAISARDAANTAKNDAVNAKSAAETAKSASVIAKNAAIEAKNVAEKEALLSEGYAVGTQNGAKVGAGSFYDKNNAKFYCEQAAAIAEGDGVMSKFNYDRESQVAAAGGIAAYIEAYGLRGSIGEDGYLIFSEPEAPLINMSKTAYDADSTVIDAGGIKPYVEDVTNPIIADVATKADKTDLAKTDKTLDRTARSLAYLWKKSQGTIYDTEEVVGSGSEVTVPSGAMDYAELKMLGGMSRKGTNIGELNDSNIVNSQRYEKTVFENGWEYKTIEEYGRVGYLFPVIEGRTYTISFNYEKTVSSNTSSAFYFNNSNSWNYSYGAISIGPSITPKTKASKTIVATSNTLFWGIYIEQGKTFGNVIRVTDFVINEGSTALPYEPYTDQLIDAKVDKVVSRGVNLVSRDMECNRTRFNVQTFDTLTNVAKPIALKAGTYTLVAPRNFVGLYVYSWNNGDRINLGRVYNSSSYTFTLENDVDDVVFDIYTEERTGLITDEDYICVVKGSTPIYTPYFSTDYPIPSTVQALDGYGIGINNTLYNYIEAVDEDNDGVTDHVYFNKLCHAINIDTSITWRADASEYGYRHNFSLLANPQIPSAKAYSGNIVGNYISNAFTTTNVNHNNDVFGYFCINGNWCVFTDNEQRFTSAETFAQYCEDNNVVIVYELATPTRTDITELFPSDWNILKVESGGSIQFHYPQLDNGYEVAVPSKTEVMVEVANV